MNRRSFLSKTLVSIAVLFGVKTVAKAVESKESIKWFPIRETRKLIYNGVEIDFYKMDIASDATCTDGNTIYLKTKMEITGIVKIGSTGHGPSVDKVRDQLMMPRRPLIEKRTLINSKEYKWTDAGLPRSCALGQLSADLVLVFFTVEFYKPAN